MLAAGAEQLDEIAHVLGAGHQQHVAGCRPRPTSSADDRPSATGRPAAGACSSPWSTRPVGCPCRPPGPHRHCHGILPIQVEVLRPEPEVKDRTSARPGQSSSFSPHRRRCQSPERERRGNSPSLTLRALTAAPMQGDRRIITAAWAAAHPAKGVGRCHRSAERKPGPDRRPPGSPPGPRCPAALVPDRTAGQ